TRPQFLLPAPRRRRAEDRRQNPLARLIGAVEQQILHHRQARETARDLECADEATARNAVGPPAGDVEPIEYDASPLRRNEAGNAVEERCLPGTVRADQPGYAAGADCEVDAVQRRNAVEAAAQPGDFEKSRQAGLGQVDASLGERLIRGKLSYGGR